MTPDKNTTLARAKSLAKNRLLVRALGAALLFATLSGCSSVVGESETNPLKSIFTPYTAGQGGPSFGKKSGGLLNANYGKGVTSSEARGTDSFIGKLPAYSAEATFKGEDGITLNLLNVPIAEAAKTVLGDILGLNYTVSSNVSGTLTVQTTNPVPKARLTQIFENILKASGYGIVERDGIYVVQSAAASKTGGRVSVRGSAGQKVGHRVHIIPLRYVNAKKMSDLLAPITQQGAVLLADDERNILMVSGTRSEMANIADMVTVFDVDAMRGKSFGLYPVQTTSPEAIATELSTIFNVSNKNPEKSSIRFIPNQRLGAILVISKRAKNLDRARSWIRKLDKAANQNEKQLYVYKIQNRAAVELADVLGKVLGADETQYRQPDNSGSIAPRYDRSAVSALPDTNIEGGVAIDTDKRSGSSAKKSRSAAQSIRTKTATVVADIANNALLISTTPKEYKRILPIIRKLDILPTQVMLEAVIAEITLNDDLKFGLKWYLEKNKHKFTFSDAVTGAISSVFPGFSYLFASNNIRVVLDALSEVTNVNVVSAPSLMVMDNHEAILQIGDQVPVVTQSARSVTDPDSPIVNSVELKDTGVIFKVTPRVNDSGRVILEIEQEVSSVRRTTTSGIDSPTIEQRKISTTVVVTDGEVIALGGLIQQRDETSKRQLPILGNIPIIGAAFRTKTDSIRRTELIIFLRPIVVRNTHEAVAVTEEFRSRLNSKELLPTIGQGHYRRDLRRILQ